MSLEEAMWEMIHLSLVSLGFLLIGTGIILAFNGRRIANRRADRKYAELAKRHEEKDGGK